MTHNNFLLELVEFHLLKSGSHSLHNHREILPPGDLLLGFRSIREVDEEALIVLEGVLGIEGLPYSMVVRPSLHKDYNVFGL